MKRKLGILLFIILIVISVSSCVTIGEKVDGEIELTQIIDIENVPKDKLFTKVNLWFVDIFKNAESVIQYSDKEEGIITGKYIGNEKYVGIYSCVFSSTITVNVKDNKCRINFKSPRYIVYGDVLNGLYYQPTSPQIVETKNMAEFVKEEWKVLAQDLENTIKQKNSEW